MALWDVEANGAGVVETDEQTACRDDAATRFAYLGSLRAPAQASARPTHARGARVTRAVHARIRATGRPARRGQEDERTFSREEGARQDASSCSNAP
jgi:hypothetical protein